VQLRKSACQILVKTEDHLLTVLSNKKKCHKYIFSATADQWQQAATLLLDWSVYPFGLAVIKSNERMMRHRFYKIEPDLVSLVSFSSFITGPHKN